MRMTFDRFDSFGLLLTLNYNKLFTNVNVEKKIAFFALL